MVMIKVRNVGSSVRAPHIHTNDQSFSKLEQVHSCVHKACHRLRCPRTLKTYKLWKTLIKTISRIAILSSINQKRGKLLASAPTQKTTVSKPQRNLKEKDRLQKKDNIF